MKPVDKIATQRNFTLLIPFDVRCIKGPSAVTFRTLVHEATVGPQSDAGYALRITKPGYDQGSRQLRFIITQNPARISLWNTLPATIAPWKISDRSDLTSELVIFFNNIKILSSSNRHHKEPCQGADIQGGTVHRNFQAIR